MAAIAVVDAQEAVPPHGERVADVFETRPTDKRKEKAA
jgi:hypothetical protein